MKVAEPGTESRSAKQPASAAGPEPDVSVLVVAYNSAELIADCLGAIANAAREQSYEVLLVDNGDGSTQAMVAKNFPDVRIIPSRGNIGFAGGNNLLAGAARGRFIMLANPDLQLHPGAIDELIRGAGRYPLAAAWGGVTLDRTGRPDVGNTVHVPSLREMVSRLFGRSLTRLDAGQDFSGDERVEALSGGFVMFSRQAWEQAGGLDDRYFLYCEEVDLFFRLSQMGYRFWRIASARAFHDAGHGNDFSQLRLLYRAAGTMQFMLLHWSYPRQIVGFALMWLSAMQRFVAGQLLGRWKPSLRRIGEGYRHVALKPHYWRHGYDPVKGLRARLANKPV